MPVSEVIEHDRLVASAGQLFGRVAPNVSCPASHQNLHG